MLTELHIENILLIDKVDITFNEGFSVITGQTGAGKSILLDSLGIILGDRAGISILRKQEQNGIIIATFNIDSNNDDSEKHIKQLLYDGGFISNIDENTLIIKKIITKNGSKIFINDIQTTTQFVKNITRNLLEIYSQFEQMDLFSISKHLEILDNFGKFNKEVLKIKQLYLDFVEANNIYENTKLEIEKQKANIEYLTDFIKDVEALRLGDNEYDTLLTKKKQMVGSEKIATYISNATNVVNDIKIGQIINKAQNYLIKSQESLEQENTTLIKDIQNINDLLEKSYNDFQIAFESLNDLNSKYNFDETELNEIEDRVRAINEISRKYQTTPYELNNQYILAKEKISKIKLSDKILDELKQNLAKKKDVYFTFGKELSHKRKNIAKKLEDVVLEKLSHLKMDKVRFNIDFAETEPTENGIDKIIFFASMNPGTQLSPIHKIASGGELSRFMVAFKSALCCSQQIETIIFDEIDTGVSGSVAYAIGKELLHLSKTTQVICITHNPQTASCGVNHLLVSKEQSLDDTKTTIKTLSYNERVIAIAEMISCDKITDESIQNAKKLLQL